MSEANKALVMRWFEEVWNQGKESTIDELFHPEGQCMGFPEPHSVLSGPEAFKAVHRQFHSAFSNIRVNIDEIISEGDRVSVRWTALLDHQGDALGFPASGQKADLSGSSFLQFRDGKILTGWNYMDFTRVTLQLQGRGVSIATA